VSTAWRARSDGERSYLDLVDRPDDVGPAGYRVRSQEQRALLHSLTELLADAGERAEEGPADVGEGAPRPEPVARIVPAD
jgi:hypothetical protein